MSHGTVFSQRSAQAIIKAAEDHKMALEVAKLVAKMAAERAKAANSSAEMQKSTKAEAAVEEADIKSPTSDL